MLIDRISFYQQFKCTGGDCHNTCCRGWMIPLTEEDIERFRHEKGFLKLALTAARSQDDIVCLNKGSGRCPFHNKDSLCSLQLKKGHDFIPEACRMFPRFYRNYKTFEEQYLDPACTEAARLMLENAADLHLVSSKEEPSSLPCTTNDDTAFLENMILARTAMHERLNGAEDANALNKALNDILDYSSLLQNAYLKGENDCLSSHPFKEYHSRTCRRLFPMGADFFRSVMSTSFYHIRLKRTNPFLYGLCDLYFNKYADIMNDETVFNETVNIFMQRHKEAVPYGTACYIYYLYLHFLKSYEDYSFVKNSSIGIIHLNMIFLFSILKTLDDPSSYPDSLPDIISMYCRRACFNDEIRDEMYRCLPADPA